MATIAFFCFCLICLVASVHLLLLTVERLITLTRRLKRTQHDDAL